jgi:transcriptional regulator with XRE-family HTH domain
MSTTPVGTLRTGVAEEVRVMLARKRVSGLQLAERIGHSQAYISRRLNGETAFDVDDLERIAIALGVTVYDLLPRSAGLSGDTPRYGSSIDQKTSDVDAKKSDRRRPAGVNRPPNVPPSMRRPSFVRRPAAA